VPLKQQNSKKYGLNKSYTKHVFAPFRLKSEQFSTFTGGIGGRSIKRANFLHANVTVTHNRVSLKCHLGSLGAALLLTETLWVFQNEKIFCLHRSQRRHVSEYTRTRHCRINKCRACSGYDGNFEDEVIAVAQRTVAADVAVGPSASFGISELQNAPAINRNITDILRSDPRIAVDESSGGTNAIQCAGQNSRFNSFTLDGVQLNDAFGLNQNGYPTERQPYPFDALEQVSVELAPLDVIYGNFTACNINSVTKSGTNSFSGSAFIDYTDDSLIGNKAKGQEFEFGEFDEIRYGVTLGGPIIKDKLFFFAAYEKLEGANTYPNTSITLNSVSQSTIDEIVQISNDVYQSLL